MKTTLTLAELIAYYEKEKSSKIIYCSEEQERHDEWDCHDIEITFHAMLICMYPNLVVLKSDLGIMSICCVHNVEIDTKGNPPDTVLTVICHRRMGTPSRQKYTFILQ